MHWAALSDFSPQSSRVKRKASFSYRGNKYLSNVTKFENNYFVSTTQTHDIHVVISLHNGARHILVELTVVGPILTCQVEDRSECGKSYDE